MRIGEYGIYALCVTGCPGGLEKLEKLEKDPFLKKWLEKLENHHDFYSLGWKSWILKFLPNTIF